MRGVCCYFWKSCGFQTKLQLWSPQLHPLPAVWVTKFQLHMPIPLEFLLKEIASWRLCHNCLLFPSCGVLHPIFKMILWKTISNRGFLSSVSARGAENWSRKEFPVRKCSAQLSLAWLRPLQRGCANFGRGQQGHSVNVWPGALETGLLSA